MGVLLVLVLAVRGPIGEFGAPRSGGRVHEGFDVVAACGAELVAVTTGRVMRVGFDPVLYGNYLLIHGQGENRAYFYAHLPRPPSVHEGERVWEGSGSARWGRPATRSGSAATSTSRSTSLALRSTPSPPCVAGTAIADRPPDDRPKTGTG
jgi:hypothetical protein